MNVDDNKTIAYATDYGLIDPFIKNIVDYVDFSSINSIYDIGSRDALQSIEFHNVFPSAQIYAFEANPEAVSTCIKNIDKTPNITLIPKAVSDKNGEITFYCADLDKSRDVNIGISSMLKLMDRTPRGWHWVQKEVTVPSITLNSFIKEGNLPPDLIWMDVQGAELMVLKGADEVLPNVKAIFTEAGKIAYYHGHGMIDDINNYLSSFGFKCVLELPGHEFESDFLFIK